MLKVLHNVGWTSIVILALIVGLYPATYVFGDMSQGFLSSKPSTLLASVPWCVAFYMHLLGGGISLMVGWSQFVQKLRNNYRDVHRFVGKTYIVACLIGGAGALYIMPFANGGIVSSLGFGSLAVLWIGTTIRAYVAIRKKQTRVHYKWMVRSYALTFAAVMLRIWVPLSQFVLHADFIQAYQIISWLCWIPNLFIAEFIIRTSNTDK